MPKFMKLKASRKENCWFIMTDNLMGVIISCRELKALCRENKYTWEAADSIFITAG